jgi:hypothetical protein
MSASYQAGTRCNNRADTEISGQQPAPQPLGFDRDRLPDPVDYFESHGFDLQGRGQWRTTRCDFHGGSDSMRINTRSGGWCCMNCGTSGGDVLAFHMQINGMDFVQAARDLGCWTGEAPTHARRPAGLSHREALEMVAHELQVAWIVLSDARRGLLPPDADWQRYLVAVSRVQTVAMRGAA